MGNRKRRVNSFNDSAYWNSKYYQHYVDRLTEIALSRFEWVNLPDTCDARFLELCLLENGMCVFFWDEVLGYLNLQVLINGGFNVYRIPVNRRAFAVNGYQKQLTEEDSVIIYGDMLRSNCTFTDILMYAKRLAELDRIIDVNCKNQKTPLLIKGSESQMLTLKNLYMKYDGNVPVLFGDDSLDISGFNVLQTNAPYISDKIYELKSNIWNEALTYLGIANLNIQKKERMITDEVLRSQGGTVASRQSGLNARKQACDMINRMFGLNVDVRFNEDLDVGIKKQDDGKDDSDGEGGEVNEL